MQEQADTMHGTCRGNPEGLNGVITPSPASHVKAEPKAEPGHDESDLVMEDVKAEPKSPPPPKQQVRALFLIHSLIQSFIHSFIHSFI